MFLSIDIGGTKTLLALFSSRGFCLKRFKFKTNKSPKLFLRDLDSALKTFLKSKSKIKSVTVAVPGIIKSEQNFCSVTCENLSWKNFDLKTPIKSLFSCKIFFLNDANLATLYEASRLKTKKNKEIIYLTFSTGIGGGIFENNRLSPRSNSFEPGHKKYLFNDKKLEWEDFASAKALNEAYKSPLSSLKPSKKQKSDIISRLSPGLSEIISSESPDIIIIGGSLAFLYKDIKPSLNSFFPSVIFKKAYRPTESVIYGAYIYGKENS